MRFWDASAVVALTIAEPRTPLARALHGEDGELTVWWATEVECISAVARLERERVIGHGQADTAIARLDELAARWVEVDASPELRKAARRLVLVHPLKAADALQLAAAAAASENEPLGFVSFDSSLRRAADLQGFTVLPAQQQV